MVERIELQKKEETTCDRDTLLGQNSRIHLQKDFDGLVITGPTTHIEEKDTGIMIITKENKENLRKTIDLFCRDCPKNQLQEPIQEPTKEQIEKIVQEAIQGKTQDYEEATEYSIHGNIKIRKPKVPETKIKTEKEENIEGKTSENVEEKRKVTCKYEKLLLKTLA